MGWNFGDIVEAVEDVIPQDAPAFIHGARVVSWREAARSSTNLAQACIANGAQPGEKIAFYLRNCPEYLIAVAAGWKARLTHVNVNYRYTAPEVAYILDNADATVVVYGREFAAIVAEIAPSLPLVKLWVEVGDGAPSVPGAQSFAAIAEAGNGARVVMERSPDDEFFIYTGGTTGMPKGVMWTHGDLREITLQAGRKLGPVPETIDQLKAFLTVAGPQGRILPAPPLMHGTGLLTSMAVMMAGGCVVTLENPTFDPIELLEAIHATRPTLLVIVGDAFGRPILNALRDNPGKYDVSSIAAITSSGVMWSLEVKNGLLEFMSNAILNDAFSSSEALGMGTSVMVKGVEVATAKFMLGERCKVFDADDNPVLPGSGVHGIVAIGPPNPLGYYKDAEKSARTFRTINGVRYSIPGDWCVVEADGSLTLLGRGSACINTAGEKVFPEEVEEALKTHPAIADALVIGLPDERWGQSVTGVVHLEDGATLDEAAICAYVRTTLAGYKTPKRLFATDQALRASNGKADYKTAREIAEAAARQTA